MIRSINHDLSTHPFYIVDVFAECKYAGNQLAVVQHAADLTASQMQDIAREMHFSETTFILSDQARDGGYDVRIFTPGTELPFAGHPTLGTAFVIREHILRNSLSPITLNLGVGPIPVTFQEEVAWMRQVPPAFGGILEAETLAQTLRIPADEFDARFPVQQVSTGIPFLIVPLKHLAAIQAIKPDWEAFTQQTAGAYPRALIVFCPETEEPDNQLHVRGVFGDEFGIAEDPATGSGNGCLAGYLVKYRYFGSDSIDVRVEQGYEIHRPSLLMLRAAEKNETIQVNVGGKVFLVARGELV